MKNTVIRIISVVISLAMLLVLPVTASAAVSSSLNVVETSATTLPTAEGANPVIVVNGWEHNNLYVNPNSRTAEQVFPPDPNAMVVVAEAIVNYILMGENYYDEVTQYIGQTLAGYFKYIPCNLDGTPQTGVGVKKLTHSLAFYQKDEALVKEMAGDLGLICAAEAGFDRVYVFSYDWRCSPMDLASEFNDFVHEVVMKETGASKVNILAEGMGANVTSAFMNKYEKPRGFSEIDNYVLVNSAAQGMSIIGALYTGNIDVDPNGVIRWVNDRADNIPVAFGAWLSNYILNKEEEINYMVTTIDTYLIHELPQLYDQYLREMLCYNAGLWGLIPWTEDDEFYELAKKMMYIDGKGNRLHMNGALEQKIDAYHEVQRTAGGVLQEMQKEGVKVAIVSGYNMQIPPFYNGLNDNKGSSETSDGVIDTKYSSFGATCAYLNDDWVGKYLIEQRIDDGHKHTNEETDDVHKISVDASTCVLPENTWLIKGLKNDYIHSDKLDAHYFISWLIFADEQRDVRQNGYYPQFMMYDRFNDALYGVRRNDGDRFKLTGDINLDGVVDSTDARLTLRAAAKLVRLTGARAVNADVDGYGKITATDARWLLRAAAQVVSTSDFPANQKKN